ncbi:SIMPL domain-containing protein [Ornithinibacillus halotolerans]|uniref:DUF541 domain-containing protein n=1 Tax=Ornithinibacillus halotolerans TaxID=1274357 RepID=A0A916S6N2_9BACI|nr:SIMPL domain-containing protein [Ornithinibacillus halotolerans]GGA83284.1 hypothetical protein GCM10008025_28050 [Ornithinibacillus halotolerans]
MYYYLNPYHRQFPNRNNRNTVKVLGEGTVMVQPDQASVVLGVVTEGKDLQQVQTINAERTRNVINALINSGIAQEDIQTSEFRIDILYNFENGIQTLRGYQVTNLLTVLIKDINKVGEIVDIAVEQGANTVRNINMTVSNQDVYYRQALGNAIIDAQEKAQVIAKTLDVTVNPLPIRLRELTGNSSEPPRPFVLGASTEKGVTTPIEPGQYKIIAQVEAEFTY